MAIKILSVKCPDCGATLDFKEGRTQIFCSYCGARVLLHNENEYIYRYVDEAEVKKAETEAKKASVQENIALKKLEYMENVRNDEKVVDKEMRRVGIALIVIGIIAMFYFYAFDGALHFLSTAGFVIAIVGGIIYSGSSSKKKTKELVDVDPNVEMLELPSVGSMTVFTSYTAFVEVYKAAGFENIKCIPLGDLKGPLDKRKVNRIGDVTIDGKSFVFYGNRAPKTVPIVITYHSY